MIALFGGTFDPIHNGHLYIANETVAAFGCEKVIFIPNREPTQKQAHASVENRVAMVELAIDGKHVFEYSNVEIERPGPSYMIDTVKTLIKFTEESELALILGADAYANFTTWLHYDEILDYAKLIVINREDTVDTSTSDEKIDSDSVLSLNVEPCPISATEIRQRLKNHESIETLVPEAVGAYIEEHKLYQE